MTDPTTQSTPSGTPVAVVESPRAADDRCEMCSHPMNKHDGIATRYCAATQMNALSRNCICPR